MIANSWFGSLPEGWRAERLRSAVRLVDKKLQSPQSDQPYIGLENVESWTGRLSTIVSGGAESTVNEFYPGDVLFGKLRPYLAKALYVERRGECSTEFLVLRPNHLIPKFLLYTLLSKDFIEIVNAWAYGVKMPRVSWDLIGTLMVPIPPRERQASIVDFLDSEAAEADALVQKYERLIELLEEKRVALITRVVTKGLDASAAMKESGIPWLGRIPRTWNLIPLSRATAKITNGYVGPTRDILNADGVRYLQSLHIKDGEIRFDEPYYVSAEWSHQHRKSILREGDVLIVQTGDIGQVAAVPAEFAGSNCHALIIASPRTDHVLPEFLSYVLRSAYGKAFLQSIQTGALHPHLNCGNVKYFKVPTPPLEEQSAILKVLNANLERLRDLTRSAERARRLVLERRTALITAAITGEIDVTSYRLKQRPVEVPA